MKKGKTVVAAASSCILYIYYFQCKRILCTRLFASKFLCTKYRFEKSGLKKNKKEYTDGLIVSVSVDLTSKIFHRISQNRSVCTSSVPDSMC